MNLWKLQRMLGGNILCVTIITWKTAYIVDAIRLGNTSLIESKNTENFQGQEKIRNAYEYWIKEAATLNFVDVHKILGEIFHTKAKVSSRVPTCACDTIRIIKFYFAEFTLSSKRYLGKGGNFLLEELLNSSAGKCPIEVDFCTFEDTERVLTEENPLGPNSSLCNVQIHKGRQIEFILQYKKYVEYFLYLVKVSHCCICILLSRGREKSSHYWSKRCWRQHSRIPTIQSWTVFPP